MYMFIHVCICMYKYVYMYVYVYMRLCIYAQMFICIHIYIYIYIYLYVCARVYVCMYLRIHICTCIHVCTYTSVCFYIHSRRVIVYSMAKMNIQTTSLEVVCDEILFQFIISWTTGTGRKFTYTQILRLMIKSRLTSCGRAQIYLNLVTILWPHISVGVLVGRFWIVE